MPDVPNRNHLFQVFPKFVSAFFARVFAEIVSIMEQGFGKRTVLNLYKVQGRGGSGIKTAKVTSKTGKLTNAYVVNSESMKDKDLIIISEKGQVIRLPFKSVNQSGRDTQGVRLMRFKDKDDKVACVTWV